MRGWTFTFAALTAALCVALAFVLRENSHLRDELERRSVAAARASGLAEGASLAPFELLDSAGKSVRVDFAESVGTVLLFYSAGCDACADSRAHWQRALAEAARPDVRILCVQTDGAEALLALEGLPASLAVPLPPEGWLAAIPAVPATLVVDEHGVLRRAWYSALDAGTAAELIAAIDALGGSPNAPPEH